MSRVMIGLTVAVGACRIAVVIELRVFPTVGAVAVDALAAVMAGGGRMAAQAVCQTDVVDINIVPIFGGMAGGAAAVIVAWGRVVAGFAVVCIVMVHFHLPPIRRAVAA